MNGNRERHPLDAADNELHRVHPEHASVPIDQRSAVLPPTTCALVTTVPGATKKPLPWPSSVSTVTTADIDRRTRSSVERSDMVSTGARTRSALVADASSSCGGAGGSGASDAGTVA